MQSYTSIIHIILQFQLFPFEFFFRFLFLNNVLQQGYISFYISFSIKFGSISCLNIAAGIFIGNFCFIIHNFARQCFFHMGLNTCIVFSAQKFTNRFTDYIFSFCFIPVSKSFIYIFITNILIYINHRKRYQIHESKRILMNKFSILFFIFIVRRFWTGRFTFLYQVHELIFGYNNIPQFKK